MRERGVHKRYFIAPQKDGELHLILELQGLNCALRTYRFKMQTLVANSIQKLVTIDLSPAHGYSIPTTVRDIKLGQKLSVLEVQRFLGIMAAVASVITLGLLYMRLYEFWLKSIQKFSPSKLFFQGCRGHEL